MKIIKALAVTIVTLTLGSCFDPPEFPNVPRIEFAGIKFIEGNATNRTDSLIISINFQDGDGDLGVDANLPEYNSAPNYNNIIFYQRSNDDPKALIRLDPYLQPVEHFNAKNERITTVVQLLPIQDATKGKLVTPSTRSEAGYEYLPANSCEFYQSFEAANYAIEAKNKAVLDPGAVVDTLFARVNGQKVATHFILKDFLYFTVNPTHYNIDVDYLVKDPANPDADGDGYVKFNWRGEPFCQQDLNGRFPILTDKVGPLEGTITYAMTSIGFRRLFTIKTLRLRVKIRDRAYNESNTILSKEFTLDSI